MDALCDYETPNILFFTGISLQKYDIDIMWTKRLLESLQEPAETVALDVAEQPSSFDKAPEYFTTLDEWPRSTNLRCGSCSRNYKSRPAAVITHVYNTGNQIATKMRVLALMCSFDCAVRFINTRFRADRRRWEELHKMLRLLYHKMTGMIAVELNEAPDILDIAYCGGNLSINDFIKRLKHVLPAEHGGVPLALAATDRVGLWPLVTSVATH